MFKNAVIVVVLFTLLVLSVEFMSTSDSIFPILGMACALGVCAYAAITLYLRYSKIDILTLKGYTTFLFSVVLIAVAGSLFLHGVVIFDYENFNPTEWKSVLDHFKVSALSLVVAFDVLTYGTTGIDS
ncbi:hypothetical protein HYG89_05240 [Acinetobacter sp. SwsAc5]|uniref:hypothetical protein n=1 Tax=Acinetobacter sp. SwsAc5 TaxID=2749438 RepID=UPI0015BF4227|nr:hypothetical protein [Acinetobacter sp. SwsAc5]NWK51972.1 hypothetical protein [Acinetobacter sp. SwsAc5]